MICNECGKEFTGSKCSCIGKKRYGQTRQEEEKLSSFDEVHRDAYLLFNKIRNEFYHFETLEKITGDPIFKDLKVAAREKAKAFKLAQGRFYADRIAVPWFWQCKAHQCQEFGTMSTGTREDSSKYCKTHFNG